MKKIAVLSMALAMLMGVTACGSEDSVNTTEATTSQVAENETDSATENNEANATVDLEAIRDEMISTLKIENASPIKSEKLEALYGITGDMFQQAACFITSEGVFPHEVVMVEAVDATAAANVAEKLSNRLNEVLNQAKDYDPDNYELAKKCSVATNGNYVTLFISPEFDAMTSFFAGKIN